MSGDWVPFHRRLAQGPKKAIARGIRFVLLELSLEARHTEGVLDFPVGWSTLDAVHDLLGGDRREIRKAIELFSIPDESGAAPLKIERDLSAHRLTITKWRDWAGPKSSTERSRDHRENKRLTGVLALHGATEATPTVQDSTEQDRTPQRATPPARKEPESGTRFLTPVPPPPEMAMVSRLAQAYAEGIADGSGLPWRMPDANVEAAKILDGVTVHAPNLRGERLEEWVKQSAATYRRAAADRCQYERGYRPAKWLEWLNAGGDKMQRQARAGAPLVQRDPEEPEWIKKAMSGDKR